ncbi:MAG TPA: hypothetical protein VF742_07930, partial [Terracidiphilus sp.]
RACSRPCATSLFATWSQSLHKQYANDDGAARRKKITRLVLFGYPICGTVAGCGLFGIPLTLHWTGAAIIEQ